MEEQQVGARAHDLGVPAEAVGLHEATGFTIRPVVRVGLPTQAKGLERVHSTVAETAGPAPELGEVTHDHVGPARRRIVRRQSR
jgi:hypothetical protein